VSIHNPKQTHAFVVHETELHKVVILVMFETSIQVLAFPTIIAVVVNNVPLVVAFLLIVLEMFDLFVRINMMECLGSVSP